MEDLSRLAIHTMTNKPWSLRECVDAYARAGIGGVSVWRNVLAPHGPEEAGRIIRDAGLSVPALVRGGFFPAREEGKRQEAIDENRRCVDEAAGVGADMVVLVVGAVPGMPLAEGRKQVAEGLAAVAPHAAERGVRLAVEPLHPMYAADRSCINTVGQAREVCVRVGHPSVGIAVDVYHVWWDPSLEEEIRIAGRDGRLLGFHLCDWRVGTRDVLTDRGLMGDGCIDLRTIRQWVDESGFRGLHEVEVFSETYWSMDQQAFLEKIQAAYREHV